MKIKDLKQPYKALALVRQKEQGNNPNEDVRLQSFSAFNWLSTKEGHRWWDMVREGNYPPIPPDSLKDIPLQVRWDSGERFRGCFTKLDLKELHVFENGYVAFVKENVEDIIYEKLEDFLNKYEPIPSEPQTRCVNVYVSESGNFKSEVSVNEEKSSLATFSFQQQLINSKWVNV